MAKYNYVRLDPVDGARTNIINFDSSPKYSLTKQYGFSTVGFELREVARDDRHVTYDVMACYRSGGTDDEPEYGPTVKRGTLVEKTTEELMSRF